MRKGRNGHVLLELALVVGISGWGAATCRAQAANSLAEPVFQQRMEQMDLASFTPRLTAMGGAYIAVDDPNNLINLWRLDRNPAALIEDVPGSSVEVLGNDLRPRTTYGPGDSELGRYEAGVTTERFGGAILQTRWRNHVAGLGELSYRSFDQLDIVGAGLHQHTSGNGPRLGVAVNERLGRLYYGGSVTVYNVDESSQFIYDPSLYDSAAVARVLNQPELTTDRVSYHSVLEVAGLQYQVQDALRIGGTLGLEQQRIAGASSNQRMQLDALNNRNLIRESLGGTYRYRDKVAATARFFHNSYNAGETFSFTRRKRRAQTDNAVDYDGQVADRKFRTRLLDARATWRPDPRRLQLGLTYATGRDENLADARVGPGSYNFMDSTYLLSSNAADSVGVSGGPLIDDFQRIERYIQWGIGGQYHPNPRSTVVADFTRYTSNLIYEGNELSPERRSVRVGGEYLLTPRFAVRAGYAHLRNDEDRNKEIDKHRDNQISFGLGYTVQGRKDFELVYLSGNQKSDFPDPSHLEVREHGLHLYGRWYFQ